MLPAAITRTGLSISIKIMNKNIHPTAIVDASIRLPDSLSIGAYSRIESGVCLGEETHIGEFCVLGGGPEAGMSELQIGKNSIIRSHTIIYAGSGFGDRLETGHHVVIREKTVAGANLRVGNFSDIEGHSVIGDYCRFHGYVHIGKGSRIGNFVWLYSLVTATNDPLPPSDLFRPVFIGDGVVVCVGALLMPGVEIGDGAFVTAGSKAEGKIPNGAVVSGDKSEIVSHVGSLIDLESGVRHPWMRHLKTRYLQECQERLDKLMDIILKNRFSLKLTKTPKNESSSN
jgi:UDP-3-O-[3-hydroxymyristoyl] glucosamine N-acyltransferase